MKHEYHEIFGMPIVIVDDFYDEIACKKIWQELCFLNNDDEKLFSADKTGSAWVKNDGETKLLKSNRGVFLDEIYSNRNVSNILKENRKIFSVEFQEFLVSKHPFFRYIKETTLDTSLVQYYENNEYYDYHVDRSIITFVSWFYKKPKGFTGGNLIIENELHVECKHNRVIAFPSIMLHSVENTVVPENLVGDNYGRYSITQLTGIGLR